MTIAFFVTGIGRRASSLVQWIYYEQEDDR